MESEAAAAGPSGSLPGRAARRRGRGSPPSIAVYRRLSPNGLTVTDRFAGPVCNGLDRYRPVLRNLVKIRGHPRWWLP